ncbi:anthranilate synthase component I [Candidatus Peregrinibacteria bacterium CG10_big_fil_rev_8_21_14_0_10_54_7]|nr:MAG: anthranilate synthase component I [Candidatus Peregrinibacteria bacterium CG10_big_fil_rev_8_21_14_0_10_54_7]
MHVLLRKYMYFPLITITVRPEHCDPLYLLRELGLSRDYCALLESADRHSKAQDFSFVALGARDVLTIRNGEVKGSRFVPDGKVTDALSVLSETVSSGAEGERLRMGYIGFLSYEAARDFEDIDLKPDPLLPDSQFVLPEVLLKIDHRQHEITIVAHRDTAEDLESIERVIHTSPFREDRRNLALDATKELFLASQKDIAPYRKTTREDFCHAITEAQEKIRAGEVFQIVISQKFVIPDAPPADRVYEQLREINPSPYMFFFQTPDHTLVGASPEMLVRVDGRTISYRPIAGTRRRTGNAEEDRKMEEELLGDAKERSEHQMLVDLGRNDVGRVAKIGSVKVKNPFHVETYAHVFHIVSDITATMRDDVSALDVVRSVFPAGTLTGAPKIRAMEIIRELEQGTRGIYGGTFGYIDFSGNVDFAITIRTMLFRKGQASLRVGAGIVKDSIPEHEDDECLHKARSCLAALHHARSSAAR